LDSRRAFPVARRS